MILNIIMFMVVFIFVFLLQYNFVIKPKKKKGKGNKVKNNEVIEIEYLSSKFKIDKNKLKTPALGLEICFINAFIISFVSTLISNIPLKFYYQFMIGFVILIAMIYGIYEIYGRNLVKKFNIEKKKGK